MNFRLCAGAAIVVAGLFGSARAAEQLDIPFETFRLANGLTVVVHEDHKAPIVAVAVWYHVGSKDEKPGKTGFAHLFEHLMYQGSENHKDEFFKPFELVGATEQNGSTWPDRTNYFQNVPTTAVDLALWMESDRMGHLLGAIDQKVLDEQRGVVQNEKREGENQPYGRAYETILKASYPEGHPYRWEAIGSMDDLNAASLDDVKNWFREYYGAANATLVLAGDIDVATAKAKAQKYFGDIAPGPTITRREVWIAPRTESTRDVQYDKVSQARVYRSYNVPGFGSADDDYLGLVARILGGGKTSRLYKRLAYTEQLVDGISAGTEASEIGGLFMITADIKNGVDGAKVEAEISEEIARFIAEGPSAEELERAKILIRAGFVRGVERVGGFSGKAQTLAECQVMSDDAGCFRPALARLQAATPAQVRDAAARWLKQGDYTLTVLPQPDFVAGKAEVDRSSGLPKVDAFPDLKFPQLQRAKLANGMNLVFAERHDVPVVQVSMQFDAGFAADQGRKLGLSSFTMALLDEGAGKRDALQLAERSEELGAQIGAGSGVDASSVGLSALYDKLDDSLALYADVVRRPRFNDSDIERVRKVWLSSIAQEKTQPTGIALRILPPLLYGAEHAYGVPLTGSGTEASISSITRADLLGFQRDWLRPDNATVLATGDIKLDEMVKALNRHFGDWKAPGGTIPTKAVGAVAAAEQARVYLIDKPGSPQTLILAGQLIPSSKVPNSLEIATMNNVFGGQFTARLNMNLREDKHWAYGAYTFIQGAKYQRPLLVYAPVQTDKTAESLREIGVEFDAFLGTRPATAEEIAKVKANDVRSLPGEFETASAVLGAMTSMWLYDRPDDYVQTLKARTEAQTDEHVRDAAKVLTPKALTWVIVGDLSKIEQPIRALNIGTVQIMDADGKVLR